VTRYEHDAGDRVTRIVDADGVETRLVHDFAGRRLSVTRPTSGGGTNTWRYLYDLHGNRVGAVPPHPGDDTPGDPLAALYLNSYAYDAVDRMTSAKTAPRALGGADQARLGVGLAVYQYDDASVKNGFGRLTRVTLPGAGPGTTFATTYTAKGQLEEETRTLRLAPVAGAALTTAPLRQKMTYNALGQVTRVEHADALWVIGEDQPERHVQHRHEEPDLGARRRLERAGLPDHLLERRRRVRRHQLRRRERIVDRRQVRVDRLGDVFLHRERLPDFADLAGVVEQHQAHGPGD
jgi:YD repeat-containing protein